MEHVPDRKAEKLLNKLKWYGIIAAFVLTGCNPSVESSQSGSLQIQAEPERLEQTQLIEPTVELSTEFDSSTLRRSLLATREYMQSDFYSQHSEINFDDPNRVLKEYTVQFLYQALLIVNDPALSPNSYELRNMLLIIAQEIVAGSGEDSVNNQMSIFLNTLSPGETDVLMSFVTNGKVSNEELYNFQIKFLIALTATIEHSDGGVDESRRQLRTALRKLVAELNAAQ